MQVLGNTFNGSQQGELTAPLCYIYLKFTNMKNNNLKKETANGTTPVLCVGLSENDLMELGFSKHLMVGTGWNSISSMHDAVYYYKNGRITINATYFWTWFLDSDQRNDIAVSSKEDLSKLLKTFCK